MTVAELIEQLKQMPQDAVVQGTLCGIFTSVKYCEYIAAVVLSDNE